MEFKIQCLYCLESFCISAFKEDGEEQEFIYDCEVCCHPLEIKVDFTKAEEQVFVERSSGI